MEPNREEEDDSMSMDQNEEDQQAEVERRGGPRLGLPEDGYEWKKYGQKFIKSIGKFRSYFKCQRANCMAKKRAEWCTSEPANIRILYDGLHTHASSTAAASSSSSSFSSSSSSSSNANRYNLLTQVLGDQSSTHSPPHHTK